MSMWQLRHHYVHENQQMTLQIDDAQREETEITTLQQTFETCSFETVLWVELLFRRIAIVNKQQTAAKAAIAAIALIEAKSSTLGNLLPTLLFEGMYIELCSLLRSVSLRLISLLILSDNISFYMWIELHSYKVLANCSRTTKGWHTVHSHIDGPLCWLHHVASISAMTCSVA